MNFPKPQRPSVLRTLLAVSVILFSISVPAQSNADDGASKIELETAVVLNAKATTLAFKLTNETETTLRVVPIGTSYNRISVTTPDGKTQEVFGWVDNVEIAEIPPHHSQVWKIDISNKISLYHIFSEQTGTFRVVWKIKGLNFDEHQSKEILVENDPS